MSRETMQNIDIYTPSFLSRWMSDFLLERHTIAARVLLLLLSIVFFVYGPNLVFLFALMLPSSALGSSGASIAAHQTLQLCALLLFSSFALWALRPKLAWLAISTEQIGLKWKVGPITYNGLSLPWNKIGSICIERQKEKTDTRNYSLCLYSKENSKQSLKIPLANLTNEDSRKMLVEALQTQASAAVVEPGAFEAIAPARSLSFTDIWLESLSAAPGRERLVPLSEGTTLKDRFHILKRLGGGGQATAYLATDSKSPSEPIVLKETILPVYADLHTRKQALEKFHEEAVALDKVKHPQIVSYLDSFVEDHRAYLVLQFVEGRTLRQLIEDRGKLSQTETLNFAMQMCDILISLHSLTPSLIHRDFCPDNMIVNSQNNLVLIDFAVAVNTQESSSESAGKIAYMAPEQFKGMSTVQSDIYACGASVFYMLTGKDPVALSESHPRLSDDSIDIKLDEIVARATSQTSENRFASIVETKSAFMTVQNR